MPGVEGQSNPEADQQLAELSQMAVESGGVRKMPEVDQKALDALMEERQAALKVEGGNVTQADTSANTEEAMAVHSEHPWKSNEQQK